MSGVAAKHIPMLDLKGVSPSFYCSVVISEGLGTSPVLRLTDVPRARVRGRGQVRQSGQDICHQFCSGGAINILIP